MKVEQRGWTPEDGWSAPLPPLDGPQTLVLVFGSRDLDTEEPLRELAAAFPNASIVGCSSSGEILQDLVVDESLSVAICAFARTEVRATWAAVVEGDDGSAVGRALGSTLAAHPGLRSVLTLSDGLRINGTSLAAGLSETTGEGVTVTGAWPATRPASRPPGSSPTASAAREWWPPSGCTAMPCGSPRAPWGAGIPSAPSA